MTDEEIEAEARKAYEKFVDSLGGAGISMDSFYLEGFIDGSKWMRDNYSDHGMEEYIEKLELERTRLRELLKEVYDYQYGFDIHKKIGKALGEK